MAAASLACLVVHLLGMGWLAPVVTALIAASDDEHRVLLAVNGEHARVVLAHDASRPGMHPGHEHCAVAAVLVALASEATGGTDHVLSFPSGVKAADSGPRWDRGVARQRSSWVIPWFEPLALAPRLAGHPGMPRTVPGAGPVALLAVTSTVLRC